jgi:hypothetical protein
MPSMGASVIKRFGADTSPTLWLQLLDIAVERGHCTHDKPLLPALTSCRAAAIARSMPVSNSTPKLRGRYATGRDIDIVVRARQHCTASYLVRLCNYLTNTIPSEEDYAQLERELPQRAVDRSPWVALAEQMRADT